jgi:CubicO group peptidase (beta-lactamase class C family)
MTFALVVLWLLAMEASASRLQKVEAAVKPVLEQQALRYNTSFTFGFADAEGSIGVAAGYDDAFAGNPMQPDTMVPAGSTTKAFTAIAIMQAVEAGKLHLDDIAMHHIDPVLTKLNGTTFAKLWNNHPWVEKITIRNLMQHTSGILEYDTYLQWNLDHPNQDLSPIDLLHLVDKTFVCDPSNCTCEHLDSLTVPYYNSRADGCNSPETKGRVGFYTSIGYNLLGLVLVGVHGQRGWQHFDQAAIFPAAVRNSRYNRTKFLSGPCSSEQGVAHQYYSAEVVAAPTGYKMQVITDLRDYSCLNGWTAGNVAASAEQLARFFYDMFTALEPMGGDDDDDDSNGGHSDGNGSEGIMYNSTGSKRKRVGLLTNASLQAMKADMVPNVVLGPSIYPRLSAFDCL